MVSGDFGIVLEIRLKRVDCFIPIGILVDSLLNEPKVFFVMSPTGYATITAIFFFITFDDLFKILEHGLKG